MEKPKINLIEDQNVENSQTPIDNWEAEQLMRKYGFDSTQISNYTESPNNQYGLTFEEMIQQEEIKKKEQIKKIQQKQKVIDRYNTEITYNTDEDTGFTFKIEIKTDMNL